MIKVKWLKAHRSYAYVTGDVGEVTPLAAEMLLAEGYIMLVPETIEEKKEPEKVNTLPEDFPGRDKLFAAGFETVEQVIAAGDSVLDVVGISQNMLKKIKKYTVTPAE